MSLVSTLAPAGQLNGLKFQRTFNTNYARTGDPYFGNVSLLLPMDGSNGSTTFTDNSNNALTVTRSGNAQISTAHSKFGGASALFDGTGDFLTTASNAAVALGTGDFTVECWVRRTGGSGYRTFAGTRPDSGSYTDAWTFGVGPSNEIYFYSSSFICFSATGLILLNTWHHVVLVRSNTSIRIYIDGLIVATGTNSQNFSRQILTVGGQPNGGESFTGYIDDLRVTKGLVRYIPSFTPPSTAFLDVGTGDDVYFPTTSLLLHMDGTDGSTIFLDDGVDSRTITANGGVTVSTAQSKYGGASAFFNGTTDSLSFTDPGLGTGNFTIELWFRTASSVQYAQFIGNESPGYTLVINNSSSTSGDIGLYLGGLVCATSGTDYGDDAWHHLAVTRLGTAVTIWVDGVSQATGTSSATFSGKTNFVGRNNAISPRNLIGHIDDLRITKSIARYTASFTPPTAAFPGPGTGSGDSLFNYNSLLLHMEGSDNSTTFADSSLNTFAVTPSGNARIKTDQFKYGTASGYFDGTGDYLDYTPNSAFAFGTADFTVEAWIRLQTYGGGGFSSYGGAILDTRANTSSSAGFILFVTTSGNLSWYVGSEQLRTTTAIPLDTWTHIALSRYNGNATFYINGQPAGGVASSSNFTDTLCVIGSVIDGRANTTYLKYNGWLDEYRITKGVARYTDRLTPPVVPFLGYGKSLV